MYNLYYSLHKIGKKNAQLTDICPKIGNFEPPKTSDSAGVASHIDVVGVARTKLYLVERY